MSDQRKTGITILRVFGPFIILGVMMAGLFATSPFGDLTAIDEADRVTILWMLTLIGALAGIVPVLIGMLWYPFLRTLEKSWIHVVLAVSAGVLTFAGVEMTEGILDNVAGDPVTGGFIAGFGILLAFMTLWGMSEWRMRTVRDQSGGEGIQVAYIIAIGLGLHSIGEGLAIGTAFIQGEARLLTLLVIAFLLDNVTEGPTIVAAVASEVERPPIVHFLIMGALAGGPVILGGWIGSFAVTDLLAAFFFAIGLGAILQVIWEVIQFIARAKGTTIRGTLTKLNVAGFLVGFLLMVFIDEVLIDHVIL